MAPAPRIRIGLVLAMTALVLSACSTTFTGMGYMKSASGDPDERATFGFVFDGPSFRFKGDYFDQGTGHHLRGTGVLNPIESPPPFPNAPPFTFCMEGVLEYEALDQTIPAGLRSGTLNLMACDVGEPGAQVGDFIVILVIDGPYGGYSNAGPVLGGNLQS